MNKKIIFCVLLLLYNLVATSVDKDKAMHITLKQVRKAVDACYQSVKKHQRDIFYLISCYLLFLGISDAKEKNVLMYKVLPIGLGALQLGCAIYEMECLPFPELLKNLKNFEFACLPVLSQKKDSCGWHAVINARGVQQAEERGLFQKEWSCSAVKAVMDAVRTKWLLHINKNAQLVRDTFGISNLFEGIYAQEQEKLAHLIGLKNCYYFHIEAGEIGYFSKEPYKNYKSSNNYYKIDDLLEMCQLIKRGSASVKNIILSVPSSYSDNHAVTLSIVIRKEEKPLLVYADSNNIPLVDVRPDYVVPYFVIKFITALDKAYGS